MTLDETSKAQTCINWIAHGPIFVHFDSKRPDVLVPDWIRKVKTIVIFGFDLPVPICDLRIDQTAISGTLSFDRLPVHCVIPWPAVYKVRSDALDASRIWSEDVPPALRAELLAEKEKRRQTEDALALKAQLRLIKGGAS